MIFPVKQPYQLTTLFSEVAHPGIDIAPLNPGKTTRNALAPEAGVVVTSGYRAALEGNYVIMRGKSGMFYYFGHFKSRSVKANQAVKEGQPLGVIGQTGKATGIHTHHEVRKVAGPGQSIDPVAYYKKNIGGGDMYKGKTAKEWHDHAVAEQTAKERAEKSLVKATRIAESRRQELAALKNGSGAQSILDKIKALVGK